MKKIFRQFNFLVIRFVKTLLSHHFAKKEITEFYSLIFFHAFNAALVCFFFNNNVAFTKFLSNVGYFSKMFSCLKERKPRATCVSKTYCGD